VRRIEESACLSRIRERTLETCVLCAGLGLCSLAIPSPWAGASVLVASLVLAGCAGVPLRDYLRFLGAASGFAVVSLVPLAVVPRLDPPMLSWDPQGFRTGVLAGTRAMGTIPVTLLLAFTIPFPRLVSLLRWMRVPGILVDLLALVHREIFLTDEMASRLRRALACRNGWQGRRARFRSASLWTAALFVRTLERSARIERGLASRGCGVGFPRHGEESIEVRPVALLAAVVAPALLAAVLVWGKARLGR